MDRKLSVILPVRNGGKYIHAAVESVLSQTYSDFEFIIINDGSTDETLNIINSFNDNRIKVITTTGIGLVNALNLAIENSSNELIVRMDADDICMANRFEEQIEYFRNQNIGVVCSNAELIDENGKIIGSSKEIYATKNQLINMLSFKINKKPIIHPSSMIRKCLLNEIGGYRNFNSSEDRDLWLRLSNICDFYRIQKNLIKYRIHSEGISKSKYFEQKINSMITVVCYEILKTSNYDIYDDEIILNNSKKYLEKQLIPIENNYRLFENFKENVRLKSKVEKIEIFFKQKNKMKILNHYFFARKSTRKIIKNTIEYTIELIKKGNK